MDVPLPWERLLWTARCWPRGRYLLTDFRLVVVPSFVPGFSGRTDEILVQDIGEVRRTESRLDRLLGTSTLTIDDRAGRLRPLVLRRVRRGQQLSALLALAASDPRALTAEVVNATFTWNPQSDLGIYRAAFTGLVAAVAAIVLVAIGLHGKAAAVTYASDDAICPNGDKRSPEEIARFMENSVMPWAREILSPIVGSRDRVTCLTCHGKDARVRSWQMPAVSALPMPDLADRGWETYGGTMDAQTRNAIYGYIAEADNQTKAAYMREVVMPGMARLLHRPPYDFTKPYDYNRTRAAFGCYHCHQIK